MRIHKTKIDFWLIATIVSLILFPMLLVMRIEQEAGLLPGLGFWIALIVCGSSLICVTWSYLTTQYKVTSKAVAISCGFFKLHVPLNDIKSVRTSRDLLSSPAFSLDRLEIIYGANKRVLISPKDKNGFLSDIGWLDRIDA